MYIMVTRCVDIMNVMYLMCTSCEHGASAVMNDVQHLGCPRIGVLTNLSVHVKFSVFIRCGWGPKRLRVFKFFDVDPGCSVSILEVSFSLI